MATSRVYSELYNHARVHRLAPFFRDVRAALLNLRRSQDSHVAILTPGPYSESYFEQAYIARYLGLLLVEGEDLAVQNGHVFVRTVSGLQPVDVLWRRLDALWSDPLELEEGSRLGSAGLVGAARRGTVSMVNALGTGVLETRALMAFLPRIARHLLGEPLKLPNIATWWCGQAKERRYVVQHAAQMMIAPALSTRMPFDPEETTVLAGELRSPVFQTVQQLIDEEGERLVGQEAVSFSTTPVLEGDRLVPRPMSLRVLMVRTETGWSVMPGGFARLNRAYHARLADAEVPDSALLKHLAGYMRYIGLDPARTMPTALTDALEAASRTAGNVRDRLSPDGWAAISDLVASVRDEQGLPGAGDEAARRMVLLLRQASGFTGLVHENMYRFTEWRFLSLGRSVERLMALASALASLMHPKAPDGALDLALEYGDSSISHRRRYAFIPSRLSVIELLALDPLNPRSLIFHLDALKAHCEVLPGALENGHPSETYGQLLRIHTNFVTKRAAEIDTNLLLAFRREIAALSDALGRIYMS